MKIVKLIFYNFAVLFFLFLFCEIGFNFFAADYIFYERTYRGQFENCNAKNEIDTNWVRLDTELGWVCKSKENLNFYRPELHKIRYRINKQGFRNPVSFDTLNLSSSKKRVLLLDDSFLFSILQEEQNTVSSILQKRLGDEYEILNIAVPGWGLDQMYLAYQKYVEIIEPEQVILLFIDDDISRLVEAMYWGAGPKPAYKLKKGILIDRQFKEGKLNPVEAFFIFKCQILNRIYKYFCEQKAKPLAKAFIKKLSDAEREKGRTLAAVHCPRYFQLEGKYESRHFYIETIFEEESIPFYNLRESMVKLSDDEQKALFHLQDGHPSDRGAKFIANFLLKNVLQ